MNNKIYWALSTSIMMVVMYMNSVSLIASMGENNVISQMLLTVPIIANKYSRYKVEQSMYNDKGMALKLGAATLTCSMVYMLSDNKYFKRKLKYWLSKKSIKGKKKKIFSKVGSEEKSVGKGYSNVPAKPTKLAARTNKSKSMSQKRHRSAPSNPNPWIVSQRRNRKRRKSCPPRKR